jgi:hypothetical protein
MVDMPPGVPDHFSLDASKRPREIAIALPAAVSRWLAVMSARTGRSEDELILELLDRGLREF